MVAAPATDRQRGGEADGKPHGAIAGETARLASRPPGREARPDAARPGRRAARSCGEGELRLGVAAVEGRADQFQKKACTPASKIGLMSPVAGPAGRSTKASSTRHVWCSSTKPGRKPI